MKLVATSNLRGAQGAEQQGNIHLVDLDSRSVALRSPGKATEGGRDLRGIAFDGDVVYLAGGEELFAFSPDFKLIDSWRNPYLREVREIQIFERTLYLVAAGCDGILGFDLDARRFHWAMHVATHEYRFAGRRFDAHGKDGPLMISKLDLDSIHCNRHGMYIGGGRSGGLLHFNGQAIHMTSQLPEGSRNARPFRDGVLFNDCQAGALRYAGRGEGREDRAMKIPASGGQRADGDQADEAGATGFARGLCVISDSVVAGGSDRATIALYDLAANRQLLSVALSEDPRRAIHSIAVWPFG